MILIYADIYRLRKLFQKYVCVNLEDSVWLNSSIIYVNFTVSK